MTPSRSHLAKRRRGKTDPRVAPEIAAVSGPAETSRLDVLVQVEQVVRVVLPLDLEETLVVALVVRLDALLVVLGHEVDVPALLRVRRRGPVVVAHPLDVGLVVGRIRPRSGDDGGEGGITVRAGGRIGGDPVDRSVGPGAV